MAFARGLCETRDRRDGLCSYVCEKGTTVKGAYESVVENWTEPLPEDLLIESRSMERIHDGVLMQVW